MRRVRHSGRLQGSYHMRYEAHVSHVLQVCCLARCGTFSRSAGAGMRKQAAAVWCCEPPSLKSTTVSSVSCARGVCCIMAARRASCLKTPHATHDRALQCFAQSQRPSRRACVHVCVVVWWRLLIEALASRPRLDARHRRIMALARPGSSGETTSACGGRWMRQGEGEGLCVGASMRMHRY